MRCVFIALFFAAVTVATCAATPVSAVTAVADLEQYTFERYVAEFGKKYSTEEEYHARRKVFYDNLDIIIASNKVPGRSYKRGIGPFTDLTQKEFTAHYNGRVASDLTFTSRHADHDTPSEITVPNAFSWLDAKTPVLTAVKKQGSCGSCWAHAAVQSVESMYAIRTGRLLNLSVQQVLSCSENTRKCGGTGGCDGGTVQLGWTYIRNVSGVVLESDYPYTNAETQQTATCILNKSTPVAVRLGDFFNLPPNNYSAVIYALVNKGPLSVTVDASNWQHYSEGLFDDCGVNGANISMDHAVQLVGYGTDEKTNKDYWLVRNSWGPEWGEKGYIRLLREKNSKSCVYNINWTTNGGGCADDPNVSFLACGMCGILYDVSYPDVVGTPVPGKAMGIAAAVFGGLFFFMTVLMIRSKCCNSKKPDDVRFLDGEEFLR